MYDLAALHQVSGVEALPRAGWGSAVVWRLTQPTCLAPALEEILTVRFGMGEECLAMAGGQPRGARGS